MPKVAMTEDTYYRDVIWPVVEGGPKVQLSRDLVQWVLGGMFAEHLRGMVRHTENRSQQAAQQAVSYVDSILDRLGAGFEVRHVQEAAQASLEALLAERYDREDAPALAQEAVGRLVDDLRFLTAEAPSSDGATARIRPKGRSRGTP